jgi:hypothetical protein
MMQQFVSDLIINDDSVIGGSGVLGKVQDVAIYGDRIACINGKGLVNSLSKESIPVGSDQCDVNAC